MTMIHPLFQQRKLKKKIKAELLAANSIGTVNRDATVSDGADANGKTTYTISKGYATVADTLSFNLHVGADADMTNKITVDIDVMNSANLGVKGLNVTDATGTAATYAVDAISDAIAKVSSQRSALGAVQEQIRAQQTDKILRIQKQQLISDKIWRREKGSTARTTFLPCGQVSLCLHRLISLLRVYFLCYSN